MCHDDRNLFHELCSSFKLEILDGAKVSGLKTGPWKEEILPGPGLFQGVKVTLSLLILAPRGQCPITPIIVWLVSLVLVDHN